MGSLSRHSMGSRSMTEIWAKQFRISNFRCGLSIVNLRYVTAAGEGFPSPSFFQHRTIASSFQFLFGFLRFDPVGERPDLDPVEWTAITPRRSEDEPAEPFLFQIVEQPIGIGRLP